MDEITKRLIVSAAFVALSVWVILFAPLAIFILVTEAFVVIGLIEYADLLRRNEYPRFNRMLLVGLGILIPLSFVGELRSAILVVCFVALFSVHLAKKDLDHALEYASAGLFGLIWIAWMFSYIVKLRVLPGGHAWVFFAISVAKLGDAGAYFVGKQCGKTRLIEHVSPGKTWEGAVGQWIVTMLAAFVSLLYLRVDWYHVFVLGIGIGVLSQIGDLIESMVKRNLDVKNSGTIPGLGGILDILDSLLLVLPFVYFYVRLWGL